MKYIVKYNNLPIGIYNQISKNCVEYTVDKENTKKITKGRNTIKSNCC